MGWKGSRFRVWGYLVRVSGLVLTVRGSEVLEGGGVLMVKAKVFGGVLKSQFLKICQRLTKDFHKMAPRTHTWLQDRTWELHEGSYSNARDAQFRTTLEPLAASHLH